jgi:hypothetical protein
VQAEFVTAHALDTGVVINSLALPVYGLHRATLDTHIAVLAELKLDPGSGL